MLHLEYNQASRIGGIQEKNLFIMKSKIHLNVNIEQNIN